MELRAFVEEKLLPGHRLTNIVEANYKDDISKMSRVVALIQSGDDTGNDQAFLIYHSAKVPVHNSFDLKLITIIPVDLNLTCEIDSSDGIGTEVLVKLNSGEVNLKLEMPFSEHTNAFVSDVLKAAEALSKRGSNACDFSWLRPYSQSVAEGTEKVASKSEKGSKGSLIDYEPVPHDQSGSLNGPLCDSDSSISKLTNSCHSLGSSSGLEKRRSPDMASSCQNLSTLGFSSSSLQARECQIRSKMALKENAYTDIHNFRVFIGTWNVNGQLPSVGLGKWLACDKEPPDLYAIAFQELDLNKEAFLFNTTTRDQDWLKAVVAGIHPNAKYKVVTHVRLVGMMLIVLAQESHLNHIRHVAVNTVGTGIMNKWGNKGGVSVRLNLHNTSICFVNSHMAAHLEEVERRNEDHDCILARSSFNVDGQTTIRDHDHIYFFGDMNYRINPGDYDIKRLASNHELKVLLENDQLTQQKNQGRIFQHFKEGDIHFKPTFKYDLLSDNWDSSEKQRQPAWCDRILWKGDNIAQTVYRSHPEVNISDHKPVSAVFDAGIKVIDKVRYRKLYEEMMKELDKEENEALPQVAVDTTEIIFDTIKFMQPQTRNLVVTNTGQVIVKFAFIKKLNEVSHCKPWLNVSPHSGTIMPGMKCTVSLCVCVDRRTAYRLNTGSENLYDILVFHLEGGKDIFITVTGDYERSCFGASINALVYMKKPFKDASVSELKDLESKNPKNLGDIVPYAIPKELWYLVNHILSHGMHVEGLFKTPGTHKEFKDIRDSLDAGVPKELLPGGIHAAAEALVLFLDALPEPVIPYNMYKRALEATPNFALCKNVIDELPDHHRNVFNYLMNFLKELLKHKEDNCLDTTELALYFAPILIRSSEALTRTGVSHVSSAEEQLKRTFIHHYLVNDDT